MLSHIPLRLCGCALLMSALASLCSGASAAPPSPSSAGLSKACPLASYPKEAMRRQQEGSARVSMLVQPDGSTRDAKIVRTSGYPRLDEATLRAAMNCKLKPVTPGATPEPLRIETEFVWKIADLGGWIPPAPPPEWGDFFARAEKADALVDPLTRCLTYPDLPGTTWAPDAIRAVCEGAAPAAVEEKMTALAADSERMNNEGRYAEALAALQDALRAQPSRAAGAKAAELMARHSKDQWATLATMLSAYRFGPGTGQQAKERARRLLEIGRIAWARPSAEYAVAQLPGDGYASMWLGSIWTRMGEPELAEPFLRQAMHEPSLRKSALFLSTKSQRLLGNYTEADGASLAFVTEYPDDPMGWLERGFVLDRLGKRDLADAAFARFRAFDDGSREAMRGEFDMLKNYLARWRPPAGKMK